MLARVCHAERIAGPVTSFNLLSEASRHTKGDSSLPFDLCWLRVCGAQVTLSRKLNFL